MTSIFSIYGTKSEAMTLILTIQKHPATRFGVIHSQYAPTKENLKGETLTSCHSHVREKITLK